MAQAGIAYRGAGKGNAEHAFRDDRGNRMMLKIVAALVVACLFVYIGRMTVISADAKEISRIRKEIAELREVQEYLELQLTTCQNLKRVRDEASGRLGMFEPADGQVRLISLNGYMSGSNTQTAHDGTMP